VSNGIKITDAVRAVARFLSARCRVGFNARFLLLLRRKVRGAMRSREQCRLQTGGFQKNGTAFASLSRCHATILEGIILLSEELAAAAALMEFLARNRFYKRAAYPDYPEMNFYPIRERRLCSSTPNSRCRLPFMHRDIIKRASADNNIKQTACSRSGISRKMDARRMNHMMIHLFKIAGDTLTHSSACLNVPFL